MAKVHNLAFDYSAYDNAQEAEAQRAIKYKKNPALKQKTVSVVAVIGICLLVAVVLGTMIYGRVEISSLCSEQTRQEEQLAQLQGENVSLQSELAQKTNMSKVEEYAENELGLKKLDKSQIEYVTVESDSVAKVVKAEDVLTYALFPQVATDFFKYREAQQTKVDQTVADTENGSYPV